MLARKQSLVGDPILLASDYGPEEASNEGSEVIWTSRYVSKEFFPTFYNLSDN